MFLESLKGSDIFKEFKRDLDYIKGDYAYHNAIHARAMYRTLLAKGLLYADKNPDAIDGYTIRNYCNSNTRHIKMLNDYINSAKLSINHEAKISLWPMPFHAKSFVVANENGMHIKDVILHWERRL